MDGMSIVPYVTFLEHWTAPLVTSKELVSRVCCSQGAICKVLPVG